VAHPGVAAGARRAGLRQRIVFGWMVIGVFAPVAFILERMGMKLTRQHGEWEE
jgi:hypothetical protein